MDENKKFYLVLVVIFLGFISMVGVSWSARLRSQKIVESFNMAFASNSEKFIYIGRRSCTYCEIFTPLLDKVMKDYDLSYHYVDSSNLSEEDLEIIIDKLNFDWDNFGTPAIAIVKDNKVITSYIGGDISEEDIISFLKDGNMIQEGEVGYGK